MPVPVLPLPSPQPPDPHHPISPLLTPHSQRELSSVYFGVRISRLSQTQASPCFPFPWLSRTALFSMFGLSVDRMAYEEWEEKLVRPQALYHGYSLNLLSELNPNWATSFSKSPSEPGPYLWFSWDHAFELWKHFLIYISLIATEKACWPDNSFNGDDTCG